MSDKAWLETFPLLVKYKIAQIKDGKYIYSQEFNGSVKNLKQNPPGRIAQMRMGNKVRNTILPILILHAKKTAQQIRKDVPSMITAYVCIMHHSKLRNINIPKDILPVIVWGTWWLNTHEPDVEEIEGGEM